MGRTKAAGDAASSVPTPLRASDTVEGECSTSQRGWRRPAADEARDLRDSQKAVNTHLETTDMVASFGRHLLAYTSQDCRSAQLYLRSKRMTMTYKFSLKDIDMFVLLGMLLAYTSHDDLLAQLRLTLRTANLFFYQKAPDMRAACCAHFTGNHDTSCIETTAGSHEPAGRLWRQHW